MTYRPPFTKQGDKNTSWVYAQNCCWIILTERCRYTNLTSLYCNNIYLNIIMADWILHVNLTHVISNFLPRSHKLPVFASRLTPYCLNNIYSNIMTVGWLLYRMSIYLVD